MVGADCRFSHQPENPAFWSWSGTPFQTCTFLLTKFSVLSAMACYRQLSGIRQRFLLRSHKCFRQSYGGSPQLGESAFGSQDCCCHLFSLCLVYCEAGKNKASRTGRRFLPLPWGW